MDNSFEYLISNMMFLKPVLYIFITLNNDVRCPLSCIKFLNVKASKSSDLSEENSLIRSFNLGDTHVMKVGLVLTYGIQFLLLACIIFEKDQ
jgi:hypothetical protein